jgi:hypothetical protein
MTDGERRCSCKVHVSLFYEPRKKTAIRMLLQSSARQTRWERSANVPAPSLTKAWHGCCESLSSTNVQHLRATAPFSSHFTEVCEVASHGSRRFPPLHLTNRRTFALVTTSLMRNRGSWCAPTPATPSVERPIQRGEHHADVERTPTGALADRGQCTDATPRACPRSRR